MDRFSIRILARKKKVYMQGSRGRVSDVAVPFCQDVSLLGEGEIVTT